VNDRYGSPLALIMGFFILLFFGLVPVVWAIPKRQLFFPRQQWQLF
jgi:hypothetical protein